MVYLAATTSPLSTYLGIAVYEDERYPEYWVFAGKGEKELESLIPGTPETPDQSPAVITESRAGAEPGPRSVTDEVYLDGGSFASKEEKDRRAGKVLVRQEDIRFEPTRMGDVGLVVDPRVGFHMRTMGTLIAQIPPGKRSGAHRHIYEETNYVLEGEGYSIIDDRRFDWKKGDSLCIPLFAWHQHFNTGLDRARFLVHHNRPYMERMGFLVLEHGEDANF
jgi:mannose-6-phosphate isomerase-like protein (cupin superfamily)